MWVKMPNIIRKKYIKNISVFCINLGCSFTQLRWWWCLKTQLVWMNWSTAFYSLSWCFCYFTCLPRVQVKLWNQYVALFRNLFSHGWMFVSFTDGVRNLDQTKLFVLVSLLWTVKVYVMQVFTCIKSQIQLHTVCHDCVVITQNKRLTLN